MHLAVFVGIIITAFFFPTFFFCYKNWYHPTVTAKITSPYRLFHESRLINSPAKITLFPTSNIKCIQPTLTADLSRSGDKLWSLLLATCKDIQIYLSLQQFLLHIIIFSEIRVVFYGVFTFHLCVYSAGLARNLGMFRATSVYHASLRAAFSNNINGL